MFAIDLSSIVFESPSVATRISFRVDFIAPENPCRYVRIRVEPTRFVCETERDKRTSTSRIVEPNIARFMFFISLDYRPKSISRTESVDGLRRDVICNGGARNGRFRVSERARTRNAGEE